ncbi:MAG: TIGR03663 family protein [Anaerolineae bacterium]|nr:TIGR03663 family protein [Anaerolineae bacterium]
MATMHPGVEREQGQAAGSALNRFLSKEFRVDWFTAAYVLLAALAIFTRFYALGDRVMSHDESLHTYYSWRLAEAGDFQHTPLMHGPILFHVTAFFYFLFGDNDFTSRIYPAALGVLMVLSPLLFRRWIGRYGALLASIMILISPLLMYYNRYIRHDTPSMLAAILMTYAIFMYLDGPAHLRRKARWLYLLAGGMIWNLGSKETAFIYIAIFGAAITLYFAVRLVQHFTRRPARMGYHITSIGITLGTVMSLIMIAVLSIALFNYDSLEARITFLRDQFNLLVSGTPTLFDFNVFITWSLLVLVALVLVLVATATYATLRKRGRFNPASLIVVLLLTLSVTTALIAVEEFTQKPSRAIAGQGVEDVPVDPAAVYSYTPTIAAFALAFVVAAAALLSRSSGWWRKAFHRFPELDVLLMMGTLILPWLSPLITSISGGRPTDYTQEGIIRSTLALLPFAIISIAIGLAWNPKRWIIGALVFHIPFAFFFTTMFTNPVGLASGMVGSLGYWLEQQAVKRGSQPQYYYMLVVMPVYEYLPIIGALLAALAGLVRMWKNLIQPVAFEAELDSSAQVDENEDEIERGRPVSHPNWLRRPSLILFVAWWAALMFLALTLAGEKMPWLGTHMTLPLIFMTAWYFNAVFRNVNWATFARRGWLFLVLVPLLGVAVVQAVIPFVIGRSPFGGLQVDQLQKLNEWLGILAFAALIVFLIVRVIQQTGWAHFRRMVGVAAFFGLSLLTARHAWMASFINYDLANENLVYAHAAPGIKLMMDQIEEISRRTTDGMNVAFAWGGNAWPVTWYFRDLTNARFFASNPTPGSIGDAVAVYASDDIRSRVEPLLEDRYYRFEYVRMWWPDQEYFYLNGQRVLNALDLNPENTNAALIREGMFNIWWSRDFAKYGEATGRDYSLANWPVSEKMHFYVRKDVAAQVWNYGVGEGSVFNPLENLQVNVCTENWQQLYAQTQFGLTSQTTFNHPLDIAVDSEQGRVYVAEEFGNQVSVFDLVGNFMGIINGGTEFVQPMNRPNGVAVARDGTLYVADTWNYRIRAFTPDGENLFGWGQPGQFGAAALAEPLDGFWGPRDVALDTFGNVYVADTGNKRVRVYDANGNWLRDIGAAGTELGQLDEPSGLAISSSGRLYVADTWNRRVSVFTLDGVPLFNFPVRGWYADVGRPYLGLDESRNLLYVSDPDAGRVLVYDIEGNCVGSFGQPSDNPVDLSQFNTVGALTVDTFGNVYVSDSEAGRVLKFAPFQQEPVILPAPGVDGQAQGDGGSGLIEVTPEIIELTEEAAPAEVIIEVTPEATVEVSG